MSKKLLLIVNLLIYCIFSLSAEIHTTAPKQQRVVIVGAWHIPPFFINDHGRTDGFCIDLMTTILKRRHIPYTIKVESWEKSKQDIIDGKADLTCMMFTNENSKKFRFGPSIVYTPMCAVFRKGDKPIFNLSDLKGKSIYVMGISRSGEILREDRMGIRPMHGNDIKNNFIQLAKGRGDALFCNLITAQYFIATMHLSNLEYKIITPVPPQENRMAGNSNELMNIMEEELYNMKADGTYDRITEKWIGQYQPSNIPFSIYVISSVLIFFIIVFIIYNILLQKRIRKNEKTQLELLRKYKTVFDNALIGICYFDKDGILSETNDQGYKHFDVPDKETLIKEHLCIFDHPILSQYIDHYHPEPFTGTIEYDINTIRFSRFSYLWKPTSTIYLETQINPLYDSGNNLLCIIVTNRDVTKRISTQKELEIEKNKALESDRLKTEFLANMSHEIRTPLNAIVGFAGILSSVSNNNERNECINIINKNTTTLLNLINDILDLSKIEAGAMEVNIEQFELTELFQSTYRTLNSLPIKPPNVEFTCETPHKECIVSSDIRRIQQLLTNFVTNAFKYTKKGHIRMGYECTDGGINIFVEDTGKGIPDNKIDKIFHRFEKLGSFEQGTGLGLSICQAIVDRLNGKIMVRSEEHTGSTFSAWLPTNTEKRDE